MSRYVELAEVPETGIRHVARTAARVGEAGIGAPSDLIAGAGNILDSLIKKGSVFGESAGQPLFGAGRIGNYLPTSENIKKNVTERIGKHLPEGYLEPQSSGEELTDDIVETITGLASSFLGPAKLGLKAAAALGVGGSLAKFAAKEMGASPEVQAGVKTGTMVLGSLLGHKALGTTKKDLYKASEAGAEALPRGTSVSANEIFPVVHKIEKTIASGALGAPEKKALDFLKSVDEQLNYNTKQIPLNSLTRLKKQLNNMIYNSTDVAEAKAATTELRPLKDAFAKTLESNRTKFPDVIDNLLAADDIHATMSRVNSIKDFVKDNLKENFKSNFTTLLFGNLFGPLKNLSRIKAGASLIGGTYQLGKGGLEIGATLLKSPQIRKYYWDTMNSALRQNATSFARNARKLDEAIYKEEQKTGQPDRFIELD